MYQKGTYFNKISNKFDNSLIFSNIYIISGINGKVHKKIKNQELIIKNWESKIPKLCLGILDVYLNS